MYVTYSMSLEQAFARKHALHAHMYMHLHMAIRNCGCNKVNIQCSNCGR